MKQLARTDVVNWAHGRIEQVRMLADGRLLVHLDGGSLALFDPTPGQVRWFSKRDLECIPHVGWDVLSAPQPAVAVLTRNFDEQGEALTATLVDLVSGEPLRTFPTAAAQSIAATADGRIAIGTGTGDIELFDAQSGGCVQRWPVADAAVHHVQFAANGNVLYAHAEGHGLSAWIDGQCVGQHRLSSYQIGNATEGWSSYEDRIDSLQPSPSERFLLVNAAGDHGDDALPANVPLLHQPSLAPCAALPLAWQPAIWLADDRLLLQGEAGDRLLVFDVPSRTTIMTMPNPAPGILRAMVVHPRGDSLFTARALRMQRWDLTAGARATEIDLDDQKRDDLFYTSALLITPDAQRLLSVHRHTIQVWSLAL